MDHVDNVARLMQLVGAIAAVALPFVPFFWNQPENSRKDQIFVAVVALIACLLGWPFDLTNCSLPLWYAMAACGFLLLGIAGWVAEKRIRGRFGFRQLSRDGSEENMRTVIGGPDLSPAAVRLQEEDPLLSEQELLKALDWDPLRIWLPETRQPVLFRYEVAEVCRAIGFLLATLAAIAFVAIQIEVRRMHQPLTISPSSEQVVFAGGRPIRFTATLRSCSSKVEWSLVGPAATKEDNGWGDIDRDRGLYTPPSQVDRPLTVLVVAKSVDDPREEEEVTIQLRAHPDASTLFQTEISGPHGEETLVGVEILNEEHSWCFGKTALPGVDGYAVTASLASQHIFDGYNDIICIGAASHEYVSETAEDNRARHRADVLGHWVRDAVRSSPVRVHALKIGRYVSQVPVVPHARGKGSERERLVVIVGVKRIRGTVDLRSALREAFRNLQSKHPIFREYLDHYPAEQWDLWHVLPRTNPREPASAACDPSEAGP
ncbi:MAG: hypothetical protein ACXW4P_03940 [Thermoanaerobaculia bacterium]